MPPFGRPGALPATEAATAHRLLEAAAHEFALHGYEAARVRDIVDAAGANLAAVNYHFGGKEGLYQATLADLARQARDDSPVDSPELRALPPQDQLRAFARVMLERYLGAASPSPLSRIIAHELLDPTPALGQIVRGVTGPQWARLEEIVRAILGPAATDEDVSLWPSRRLPSGCSSSSGGACSSCSSRRWRPARAGSTASPTTSPPRPSRPCARCAANARARPAGRWPAPRSFRAGRTRRSAGPPRPDPSAGVPGEGRAPAAYCACKARPRRFVPRITRPGACPRRQFQSCRIASRRP